MKYNYSNYQIDINIIIIVALLTVFRPYLSASHPQKDEPNIIPTKTTCNSTELITIVTILTNKPVTWAISESLKSTNLSASKCLHVISSVML